MNEKNQVKVDVVGDIEAYKRSNAALLEDQRRTNAEFERNEQAVAQRRAQREAEMQARVDAANKKWKIYQEEQQRAGATQADLTQEAAKFVDRLKDQAATLGLSGTALQRYRAEQLSLTAEQRKSVEASLAQIDAFDRQQASLARMATLATRAGVALAAAAVAVTGLSVRAAMEAERSERRFEGLYRVTGGTAGLSRRQLDALQSDLFSRTTHDDEEIRDAMSRLMTYRQVSGDAFGSTMNVAANMAEVMGGSLASAVEQLGRALEDPLRGLQALTRAGLTFTGAQREMIKELVETGRQAEATQLILQALKERGFDRLTDAVYQDYTKAWSGLKKEVEATFEALGKADSVKSTTTGSMDAISAALRNLRQIAETGTWYERLLLVMSPMAPGGVLGGQSFGRPVGRPQSTRDRLAEEAARGWAGEQGRLHQWQTGFDAQQSALNDYLKELDKQDAKDRPGAMVRGRQWGFEDERNALAAEQKMLDLRFQGGSDYSAASAQSYVEAAEEATQAADALIYTWTDYGQRVVMTREEFAKMGKEGAEAFNLLRDYGEGTFHDLQFAVEGWGRDTSRALSKMAFDGRFSFQSLTDAARQFGEELLALQIQRRFMGPALQGADRWLDGLFNPGQGYGTAGSLAGSSLVGDGLGGFVPALHGGGIAGRDGSPAYVNRRAFSAAPRFHNGGEVPALLQAGEEVLTRRDPRHRWNGGGAPKLTIQVINPPGMPLEAQVSEPTFDGETMVAQVILRQIQHGGPIRDAVQHLSREPS